MATAPTVMDRADMKRLLALSKKEPVSCAIGQGPDPNTGLLLMDKIKRGNAVEKELLKQVPAAKNTRFGSAVVDADTDPKLVKITVNRAVSGMARKLAKTLKGTGVTKVQILLEEDKSLVDSFEESEDAAEAAAAALPPAPPTSAPAPPGGAPLAPPHPDRIAALRAELTPLAAQVAAVADPARKAELTGLARAAMAALQGGGAPADAGPAIERLRAALAGGNAVQGATQGAAPGAAPNTAQGAVVRLAKGLALWNGIHGYLVRDLKTLEQAILEQSTGEPDFDEIRANIGNLEVVLDHLDDSLTKKLNALRGTADPAEKDRLSEEARDVVRSYQAFCDTDELMNELDHNGFVTLDTQAKMKATLAAILTTI